ncbi:MAG: glutamate--tRNA ligase [Acidimicrobiales bacterium]
MPGPRVRIAPSPTGSFHVGSARTALFNWLVARQQGGTFVLRIEDTDAERGREDWAEGITSALAWLGLDWDEGPFRQSERGALYAEAARRLEGAGWAYWCDCSREQVAERARRVESAAVRPPAGGAALSAAGGVAGVGGVAAVGGETKTGETNVDTVDISFPSSAVAGAGGASRSGSTGYDGYCRELGLGPGPGRALRFKALLEGATVVRDVVKGDVSFENEAIEDFVLVKATGAPLFLLANVVDDADMAISHVIRGEDHLSNTPKYLLLWRALGAGAEPIFAHLPMLVNEKGQKLSKRRDPVALESYRDKGFLPDAMVNYLALLGWGPDGGNEVLSREELVAQFRLEAVKPSPAFFDVAKLTHFNGVHIRALSTSGFVQAASPWLAEAPWPAERYDPAVFESLAPLVRDRVATLAEVPAMVDFVFMESPVMDPASWQKVMVGDRETARDTLARAEVAYAECEWDAASLHQATLAVGEAVGRKLGKAQAPIRVAVTGRQVGPPLFESLVALGRPSTLKRLEAASAALALS